MPDPLYNSRGSVQLIADSQWLITYAHELIRRSQRSMERQKYTYQGVTTQRHGPRPGALAASWTRSHTGRLS